MPHHPWCQSNMKAPWNFNSHLVKTGCFVKCLKHPTIDSEILFQAHHRDNIIYIYIFCPLWKKKSSIQSPFHMETSPWESQVYMFFPDVYSTMVETYHGIKPWWMFLVIKRKWCPSPRDYQRAYHLSRSVDPCNKYLLTSAWKTSDSWKNKLCNTIYTIFQWTYSLFFFLQTNSMIFEVSEEIH